MEKVTINDFINSFEITIPSEKEFLRLSRLTSLYPEKKDSYLINYERRILLYCIVTKYRPRKVLEIGTAKGYSTLCMAWAMTDHKIDGKIFTIDPNPIDRKWEFTIQMDDESSLHFSSVRQLWKE